MRNRLIGVAALVLAAGLYVLISRLSTDAVRDGRIVAVKIEDAASIPVGTPVYMAGLEIGQVERRELAGRYARLILRIREDIALGADAELIKRTPSLLSGPILELDPGEPAEGVLPEGAEITRVRETGAGDEILEEIDEALPGIQSGAVTLREDIDDARDWVESDLDRAIRDYGDDTDEIADEVSAGLRGFDRDLADLEDDLVFDAEDQIGEPLDRAVGGTATARDWVRDGQETVTEAGRDARERIRELEIEESEDVQRYLEEVGAVDRGDGTLGELVNDPELADDLDEATAGVAGFFDGLVGWDMRVGLRTEYNLMSGLPRFYGTLRMQRRPGTYYYLEIEKSGRGDRPEVSLVYDHGLGRWRRDVRIEERVRFTVQWGRRIGPVAVRAGIKESTFGAGTDFFLFEDDLEVSADLFELNFDRHPRLKLAAAYRFFGHIYLLAGVDDVLNPGQNLDIEPIADDVPVQFEELHVGRDFFLGGTLRFTDRDLAALLLIGGDALAGAAE